MTLKYKMVFGKAAIAREGCCFLLGKGFLKELSQTIETQREIP